MEAPAFPTDCLGYPALGRGVDNQGSIAGQEWQLTGRQAGSETSSAVFSVQNTCSFDTHSVYVTSSIFA